MMLWAISVGSALALGMILWFFRQRYDGDSSTAYVKRYNQQLSSSTQRPFPTPEYEYLEVRCTGCDLKRRLPTMALIGASQAMMEQLQAHYTQRACQTCGKPLVLWLRRDIVHHLEADQTLAFTVLTCGKRQMIEWNATLYEELGLLPDTVRQPITLLLATSEDEA